MGKIVMPKNSAVLQEIEAVLKIYNDANDWLGNDEYKRQLKAIIGDDQYPSSYTKKAQITSYFGFTISKDLHTKRITSSGKKMYEALCNNNIALIQSLLIESMETMKFGRGNDGCPESDSDIDPPSLFMRAALDLGYLTYKEFAYLLWKMEDTGGNYTDCVSEILVSRTKGQLDLNESAQKYTDAKPIMILTRWGLLSEEIEDSGREHHITIQNDVLSKFGNRIRNLKIYNIDKDIIHNMSNSLIFDTGIDRKDQRNRIIFGAPGTGKSFKLEEEKKELLGANGYCERVTFHPDYSYANFVGTYKPVPKDEDKISYKYVPGPFMSVLVKALENAMTDTPKPHLLLIEEINRANVAAVFGEVFQLLDRNAEGYSEYAIAPSKDMRDYIAEQLELNPDDITEIRIPNNMFIWATMNSADQGVFPMDTAFKRRWDFEYIGIDDGEKCEDKDTREAIEKACFKIEGKDSVNWNELRKAINDKLSSLGVNEDKLMGPFFINIDFLKKYEDEDFSEEFVKVFKNKVIMYLFEDAAKQKRSSLFNVDTKNLNRYSKICDEFDVRGIEIFNGAAEYIATNSKSKQTDNSN